MGRDRLKELIMIEKALPPNDRKKRIEKTIRFNAY